MPGQHVVVSELGENPLDTVERFMRLQPQSAPEPTDPHDVVVEVGSSHVNWVDLLMASGQYQHVPAPPYTPGLEYAGTVIAVGSAVTKFQPGDRVVADGTKTGPRSLSERHRPWGGWATYALAPEEGLLPLPAKLSFAQGATYLGAYITAYHALVHRARLQPGESVLILGASGTTGLAAVQVAKAIGATVLATGRSETKNAEVKALGADHVISTGAETGAPKGSVRRFRDEVKSIAKGGVDVVHDGVGGALSLESLRCVKFGARYVVVGWAATPFVARKGRDPNVLPTNLIMMKGLDVLGSPAVISAHRDPSLGAARVAQIDAWIEQGAIAPHVAKAFPIAEFADAARAKWTSALVGSIALLP